MINKCSQCGTAIADNSKLCIDCTRHQQLSTGFSDTLPTFSLGDIPVSDKVDTTQEAAVSTLPVQDVSDLNTEPNLKIEDMRLTVSTAPLPNLSTNFAHLPEGARIPQELPRYQILEIKSSGFTLNAYLVETLQQLRACLNPDCYKKQSNGDFCLECGSKTERPVTAQYLLRESSESSEFASLAHLHRAEIKAPGLMLFEQFQDIPYGSIPRYYLVEPEELESSLLASNLPQPSPHSTILRYGKQLAEAMEVLHQHRLVWPQITARNIAIKGNQAHWVNFTTVDAREAGDYQRDVYNLTAVLSTLMTGFQSYSASLQLPAPLSRLFNNILGHSPSIVTAENLAKQLEVTLEELQHNTDRSNVKLVSSEQTDVGVVREHNEDSMTIQELTWSNQSISRPVGLYVVADGMGGHSAGEVASGMVISSMARKMGGLIAEQAGASSKSGFDFSAWLHDAVATANKAVFDKARQLKTDMGTTVVAALIVGDTAYISHVGDSRAYLLNDDGISQITIDHSLVERLVAAKHITPEEAKTHPQRNVIYRTIGDKANVEIDMNKYKLTPGDSLLLCSDGLNGMLSDYDIWNIAGRSSSLSEACHKLIKAGNEAGGTDNITVIIVKPEPV